MTVEPKPGEVWLVDLLTSSFVGQRRKQLCVVVAVITRRIASDKRHEWRCLLLVVGTTSPVAERLVEGFDWRQL